ncbi:hypothetical protein C8J56DRAFT_1094660, partial [Mycena floridula]
QSSISTNKKIVTVFCAIGKQGSGAVNLLVQDGTYLCHQSCDMKPSECCFKALAAEGVEVVKADLNDRDSVFVVVKGSYGVVGITDYWTADGKKEQQCYNIVDVAKAIDVKHFVWSTLYHSDIKAEFHVPLSIRRGSDIPTDGPMPCMVGEDCGAMGGVASLSPEKYIGQDIKAVMSITTPREIAKVLEEILSEKISIKEISMEDFEKSKATAHEDFWLNC